MKLSVIGDIHGNARALRAAIAAARSAAPDRIVFLGDLLTYGHDVDEVVALVGETQRAHGAALLVGNHDQLYFDLERGARDAFESMPAWIRESVDVTCDRLDFEAFRTQLQWQHELTLERVLLAHASPHGVGDWSYINAHDEHVRAADALGRRDLRGGIFGHTHRARWFVGDPQGATADVSFGTALAASSQVLVANAGAIGQPRDRRRTAAVLHLTLEPQVLRGVFEPIAYDVDAHVARLRGFGLSEATTARLCSFFVS